MDTETRDLSHLCGWLDDGGHVLIAATMPTFAQAAPHLMQAAPTKPVLLYMAYMDLGGFPKTYVAQTRGSCVGFGHGHGNDLLQAIEVSAFDSPITMKETCTEFIYAESRKLAGILGRQDGSYGASAVKAMTTIGMIPRSDVGPYSGDRDFQWGLQGPPSNFEQEAGNYKLGTSAQVTNRTEAISSLMNGNPFTICTARGFTMTRDSDGFCAQRGRWGHCMVCAGYRPDKPGFLIFQSWGANTPNGPTVMGMPDWSFWITASDMDGILSEGDSWSLSDTPGFGAPKSLPSSWCKA